MSNSRRNFFQDAAVFTAGLFGLSTRLDAATPQSSAAPNDKNSPHHHALATKSKPAPRSEHLHVCWRPANPRRVPNQRVG